MNIIEFGELVAILVIIWVIVFQIIIPMWNGTPTFPFFRARRKLESQLRHTREAVGDEALRAEIAKQQPKPADSKPAPVKPKR